MNDKFYSNKEFTDLKKRLNEEIRRRGGFRWLDPLSSPKVGEDRTSPLSLPDTDDVRIPVDDRTYTINDSSEGSIEPTKVIHYSVHGLNPAGTKPNTITNEPNTSAAQFTVGELKNFIVGLSKINDINLFYGRDEIAGTAFRDPNGIEELLAQAEADKLHERALFNGIFRIEGSDLVVDYDPADGVLSIEDGCLILTMDGSSKMQDITCEITDKMLSIDGLITFEKNDPNGGYVDSKHPNYPVRNYNVIFPEVDGMHVMPSGEYDGEESNVPLGPNNFFDDYGALPGDGNFHPVNPGVTPTTIRDIVEQGNDRKPKRTSVVQGGIRSSTYGKNPRNPVQGNEYKPYPIYKGSETTCNNACTGLCNVSCDDACSESCTYTCTMRCGNACTSNCGNACSGCSSMCYNTCKTKCENRTGYACVKSGAKSLSVDTDENGKRTIHVETHTCQGCSYSCQFYPNKKTTCWDSGCMSKCFTSCSSSCIDSCKGGCVANDSSNEDDYKTGKGQGCSSACTMNCTGDCSGVCEGQCTTTCWNTCKQQCSDNCEYECSTSCGSGCATNCTNGCTGCSETCNTGCKGGTNSTTCVGCSAKGGCSFECQFDCTGQCTTNGCRSECGSSQGDACSTNCRMNCSETACTSLCSDQCSSQCTTCANNCGFQCGSCSSWCSNDCTRDCGFTCDGTCALNCTENCVQSCSEECGGCSNLCYSCVGMCIGTCAVKCENGCSSCANNCTFWCDTTCNQACFASCDQMCLNTCSESCATRVGSNAKTPGPAQDPTARGYESPTNREEEQRSFLLTDRDTSIVVDPMHFRLEGKNLIVSLTDRDEDVIFNIEEDGSLTVNTGTEAFDYLKKYRFSILEDNTLVIDIMEEE